MGRFLSKGSKLTLIKRVLSNLPVYFMSLFRAPLSVLHQLDKARHDFFAIQRMALTANKYHLVGWKQAFQPLDQGGLGLRSLQKFNRVLFCQSGCGGKVKSLAFSERNFRIFEAKEASPQHLKDRTFVL